MTPGRRPHGRVPAPPSPGTLPGGWAKAIAEAIGARPATTPDVPLDVRGTAFQCVWKALQAIPAGETRSYAQVAAAHRPAPQPSAPSRDPPPSRRARRALPPGGAVGQRHGGYRWGAARKAALLARESIPGSDPLRKP
jgi:AraC family transcriptional regulator of adaptative response/methylated-DNA-[protein]-cysteine methyltransferase